MCYYTSTAVQFLATTVNSADEHIFVQTDDQLKEREWCLSLQFRGSTPHQDTQ